VAFHTERNDLEPRKETGAGGQKSTYTYLEALEEVSRISNVLKVFDLLRFFLFLTPS